MPLDLAIGMTGSGSLQRYVSAVPACHSLSQQVLYFLLSTLVLTLYIDVVLSLSIGTITAILVHINKPHLHKQRYPHTCLCHHAMYVCFDAGLLEKTWW